MFLLPFVYNVTVSFRILMVRQLNVNNCSLFRWTGKNSVRHWKEEAHISCTIILTLIGVLLNHTINISTIRTQALILENSKNSLRTLWIWQKRPREVRRTSCEKTAGYKSWRIKVTFTLINFYSDVIYVKCGSYVCVIQTFLVGWAYIFLGDVVAIEMSM